MRDMNEREAAGRIGRRKGLRKRIRYTVGNVEDNGRMLRTFVAKKKRNFLELLRREVVKGLKGASYVSLIVAVGLPLVAGVCVSVLRPSEWYMDLNKPAWITGPIFSLIWIMYPIMGLASWVVWADGGFEKNRNPLVCYFLQLGLILLWSVHFFWDHEIGFALADILAVDFFVLSCIGNFYQVSPRSSGSFLMMIYFVWTVFASFLTFLIYLGNQGYAGERSVMLP
jgi:benzodiazapine receptor